VSLSARSLAEPAAASIAELESVRRDRGAGADRFRLDVERFYIRAGELVAVVGPSGSGKSTFLDLLALSLAPSSAGCFRMGPDGADVAAFWRERDGGSLAKFRREMIGYVLQSGALLPFLTAAGNIELPLRLMGRMGAEEHEQVDGLVTRLRLNAFARRLPAELSIGQRQRVAVARALVHRPILILADEPTASLDPASAGAVMALLTELAREQGSAVLVVTHDERLAARHGFSPVRCRPVAAAADGSRSIVRRDA
jgi:putative ABC transport system ATP-binding protein